MTNSCGFLLSYLRYGDHDAVLNVFTKEQGYRSFFVKGIYSAASRKKSCLFPLNELDITGKPAKEGQIQRVTRLEMIQTSIPGQDVVKNCIIMFAAEFLHHLLRGENASEAVYREIENFLEETNSGNNNAHIALAFNFLIINGIAPLDAEGEFLNPETGGFENELAHTAFGFAVSDVWKKFGTTDNAYAISLPRELRAQFLESLMYYYQQHYEHFHVPDSLEVLRQVFE